MTCDHSGPHSGVSRYLRDLGQLRLVLVCDRCGEERNQVGAMDYRPHSQRVVGQLAELTARELGLRASQTARVRLAAMICDVGRDQIPPEILSKRGPLTREEWVEVRRQPEVGAALLSDASFDDIRDWTSAAGNDSMAQGIPEAFVGIRFRSRRESWPLPRPISP